MEAPICAGVGPSAVAGYPQGVQLVRRPSPEKTASRLRTSCTAFRLRRAAAAVPNAQCGKILTNHFLSVFRNVMKIRHTVQVSTTKTQ